MEGKAEVRRRLTTSSAEGASASEYTPATRRQAPRTASAIFMIFLSNLLDLNSQPKRSNGSSRATETVIPTTRSSHPQRILSSRAKSRDLVFGSLDYHPVLGYLTINSHFASLG